MIKLNQEICHYLLNPNISITAGYLPSVLNTIVNRESKKTKKQNKTKKTGTSECLLDPKVFQAVSELLGSPTIDLFASCLCHHLPQYIAWHLDPYSQGTDAMIQKLEHRSSLCISHFQYDFKSALKNKTRIKPLLILIAPVWSTQPCYPELLNLCVREPVLLLQGKETLISPKNIIHLLMVENSLTLAAWLVSGKPLCVKGFQKTLLILSQIPDEKTLSLIVSHPRQNGLVGVLNEKLILFRHL